MLVQLVGSVDLLLTDLTMPGMSGSSWQADLLALVGQL